MPLPSEACRATNVNTRSAIHDVIGLSINLNLEGPLEPLGTDRDGTSWYRSRGPSGLVEITGLKHAVLGVQGDFNVAEISGTTSTNAIITTLLVPEFTVDLRRELIEGAQST